MRGLVRHSRVAAERVPEAHLRDRDGARGGRCAAGVHTKAICGTRRQLPLRGLQREQIVVHPAPQVSDGFPVQAILQSDAAACAPLFPMKLPQSANEPSRILV